MRSFFKSFLALSTACLYFQAAAVAQSNGNSYYIERAQQRFFDPWPDARTLSLGNASSALNENSASVFFNPAGLAKASRPELLGTYSYNQTGAKSGISEYQHIGEISASTPLGDLLPGGIGAGFQALQGGPDDYPVNSENRLKTAYLGYGNEVFDNITAGYSIAWSHNQVYSNLYNYEMDDGFRHAVGLQHDAGSFRTGIFGFFGHGDYRLDRKENGYESSSIREYGFDLALSSRWEVTTGFIGLDYSEYEAEGTLTRPAPSLQFGGNESGTTFTPKAGVELALSDWLTLQAGTRYIFRRHFFARDDLERRSGTANSYAWSLGLGVELPFSKRPRLNAGYEERRLDNGNRQFIGSLLIPF